MTRRAGRLRDQSGFTLIEVLAAVAVFALFILLIDAVFRGTNVNSQKVELASDVQQNARVAAERLTREIRESRPNQIAVDLSGTAVVFKSARLAQDQSTFCLFVRNADDPLWMRGYGTTSTEQWECFSFAGVTIPKPPYTSGFPSPCYTDPDYPCGSYTPIWQRFVGYYLDGTELKRYVGDLERPDEDLGMAVPDPGSPPADAVVSVIATSVETFTVSVSGTNVVVTLQSRGQQIVQGTAIPDQQMQLDGVVLIRN